MNYYGPRQVDPKSDRPDAGKWRYTNGRHSACAGRVSLTMRRGTEDCPCECHECACSGTGRNITYKPAADNEESDA